MKNSRAFQRTPRQPSRRDFLSGISTAAAAISLAPRFGALSFADAFSATAERTATLAADPLRPQFHLLPKANWMNDPNGPIYWRGQHHMFFQCNPDAAVWGDMHWAHAVSPDMIHWKHLPIALAPTPGGFDRDGCFSGSAVDDGGIATFVYTGVSSVIPERATLRDGTHNFREVQLLATSTDGDLRTWKKSAKPVLNPPADPLLTGFRDPFLWKKGVTWYLGVGSGQRKKGGRILVYRSTDLRIWEYVSVLASGVWNGKETPDAVDSGEMWECPELFPLGDKHVLIYSSERKVCWESGELDHKDMIFHRQERGLLDCGAFYAPKTQTAANGDRILWGWIPETRPEAAFSKAGWAGCMSLPRVLSLNADGALIMQLAPETVKLRAKPFSLPASTAPSAERLRALRGLHIENLAAEISMRLRPASFSMDVSDGQQTFLRLSYDPGKTGGELLMNGATAALSAAGQRELVITVVLDGSVIECFANGNTCLTTRVYQIPAKPLSIGIAETALRNVLSLQAWQMTPISSDRLTT